MRQRRGFTIIEVVLFIGISGFLIVGLMVGTSATIARQRYNDSVQDLAEYFRREYSAVINPENGRDAESIFDNTICEDEAVEGTDPETLGSYRGRSGCLLYGRLVVVGEDPARIYSYDVIGKQLNEDEVRNASLSTTIDPLRASLKTAEITVVARTNDPSSACEYSTIGSSSYSPQWLARVEQTEKGDLANTSILIVRSPLNGSVHTLALGKALEVQDALAPPCTTGAANAILSENIADPLDASKGFQLVEVDFCVGSEDVFATGGVRRNIRLARDGHNSSAVEVIEKDDIYDAQENPGGNKCRIL